MKTCTQCERYVSNEEQHCPFCENADLVIDAPDPTASSQKSRAQIFAYRAAFATATLSSFVACGGEADENGTRPGTGGQAMEQSGGQTNATGGLASSSGGRDTGGTHPGSGGENIGGDLGNEGGANSDGTGGFAIPIYGGPFPDMAKAHV